MNTTQSNNLAETKMADALKIAVADKNLDVLRNKPFSRMTYLNSDFNGNKRGDRITSCQDLEWESLSQTWQNGFNNLHQFAEDFKNWPETFSVEKIVKTIKSAYLFIHCIDILVDKAMQTNKHFISAKSGEDFTVQSVAARNNIVQLYGYMGGGPRVTLLSKNYEMTLCFDIKYVSKTDSLMNLTCLLSGDVIDRNTRDRKNSIYLRPTLSSLNFNYLQWLVDQI